MKNLENYKTDDRAHNGQSHLFESCSDWWIMMVIKTKVDLFVEVFQHRVD